MPLIAELGAHYANRFGSIRKRANSFEWIPKFASCFCALCWVLFFPAHSHAVRRWNLPTEWNDSRCHAFWSTNQPFCMICSMFPAFGRHHSLFHFAQSWWTSGRAYFMYTTASTTGSIQMNWPLRIIKFGKSNGSRRPPLSVIASSCPPSFSLTHRVELWAFRQAPLFTSHYPRNYYQLIRRHTYNTTWTKPTKNAGHAWAKAIRNRMMPSIYIELLAMSRPDSRSIQECW